ncbi:activating signal cointegrator 1 complex subunit 1-like isoform X2 [Harmonia axyridis]|uniref:activating signal cointegrator 1 complex subunit 1-like isoform X2 n=1 Tax=Harmonia axyridis TaxID=115357 RepID=UPI001E27538E|nr:activating signal cointegrator 1 complex subunit 1-like isoform X2 [Harmonia axyridis]
MSICSNITTHEPSMNKKNCLKPLRMWIDGKSYTIRKYDKKKYDCMNQVINKTGDEKDKQFSTKIQLPPMYYSKLARYRNPQVNSVQNETNTAIQYPSSGNDGFLEIFGDSEESIEEAKEQIFSFLADIRNQTPPLQFISIPLLSDEIKLSFEKFKKNILDEHHKGVEESIFQNPLKLHLTLAVFTLLNDQEKQQAVEVLEELKNMFHKIKTPLIINVKGLNCMNNNYSKVDVLYAGASFTEDSNSDESLQNIANLISSSFYERGLCKEYSENVKLHMTLMNTKYRKKKGGTPKRWVKREPFDATEIMKQYKDYHFGDAVFDTIHLSLMTTQGEDGFYKSIASIKL